MNKVHSAPFGPHVQTGLSLVELAVVLLVMTGIAAVALPYAGKMLDSAAHAVNAESGQELMNQLQGYVAKTGSLPDGMDSLLTMDSSGTASPALYLDDGYAAYQRDSTKFGTGSNRGPAATVSFGSPHNFGPASQPWSSTPGTGRPTRTPSITSPVRVDRSSCSKSRGRSVRPGACSTFPNRRMGTSAWASISAPSRCTSRHMPCRVGWVPLIAKKQS